VKSTGGSWSSMSNTQISIAGRTVALGGSNTIAIDDLSDVALVVPPITGQVMSYNGGSWANASNLTNIGHIDLNTAAVASANIAGRLSWNDTDGTMNIGMKGNQVVLQVGQEMHYYAHNDTAATIPNFTAVYTSGVHNGTNQYAIAPMTADGSVDGFLFIGITTMDIPKQTEGYITNFGYVRNVNTTGSAVGENWAAGDTLYVHPTTAGALTKVVPTAPNLAIPIGTVIKANANTGTIFVKPNTTYTLNDLHDTQISAITANNVVYWNGSKWINKKLSVYDLANITMTGITNNQLLAYNSTTANLEPTSNLTITGAYFNSASNIQTNGVSGNLVINTGNLDVVVSREAHIHNNLRVTGNIFIGAATIG